MAQGMILQVLLLILFWHTAWTMAAEFCLYPTRFPNVTWDNDRWQLSTTVLDQGHYQSRMSIANGYTGINVAQLGPFFEIDTPVNGDNINGWPLDQRRQTFATIGGFWNSQSDNPKGVNFAWLEQYGRDSFISGIPHWGGIHIDLGGEMYLAASTDPATISNYSSTLDMKQALMNWDFSWTPEANTSFSITYQLFTHKLHLNQAFVAMSITSANDRNATIVNVLNGDCAVRTTFLDKKNENGLICSSVQPDGVISVAAYVYAKLEIAGAKSTPLPSTNWGRSYVGNNQSSIAQAYTIELQAGQTATIYKYVGLASSDAFADSQAVARNASLAASDIGYEESRRTHAAEWASTFSKDHVDDYSFPENGSLPDDPYLIESAIVAVSTPYYLLQNTISENAILASGSSSINAHSIMVGGLGSDSYGGQIFWDADVWMQPGIVASFPFAAQGIANYRASIYQQAKQNVESAFESSQANTSFTSDAAVFSWTSGRYGNCTPTGPCFDYEYHINGDIAKQLVNYWIASGDTAFFESELFPVYESIATFLSELLVQNNSKWELLNMTDPDEYANNIDNGAFTMALIATTLTNANAFRAYFGTAQNQTWARQATNVMISRDVEADVTLEYTGMNQSVSVKQADVVLSTYPLMYTGQNYSKMNSLSDLDYYANKQDQNGPGMTYAMFSIIANQVSPSGCSSFTYQQYSEQPYARAPWFQLSEQLVDDYTLNGGTHPAFPFITGHGGANQVVLFGYLGLRYVPDWQLHVDPSLPPQLLQLKYRIFYWQGWPISAFSNQTHTTLSRVPDCPTSLLATRNETFAAASITVLAGSATNQATYLLSPNSTITIPNRRNAFNATIPNNLAQCRSVTSPQSYIPGQFPISAVDGATSTKWQPILANITSSITLPNFPPGQSIDHFYFDWASSPPINISIILSNSTKQASQYLSLSHIAISDPYAMSTSVVIVPPSSNTTLWKPDAPTWTASEMTLTVYGTQMYGPAGFPDNATGATVAEWAIVVG